MTGLRAAKLPPNARLAAAGRVLAEIAVNQGRADHDLGLAIATDY
jgi:hypothetical protein